MSDGQNFKELQYATGGNATDVGRGIECPACMELVKWARVYDGKNVGVCGCPWTGWFMDHREEIYRWRPLTE